MKELICIVCPRGCRLQADEKTLDVTGQGCARGVEYARRELTAPIRTLTSTVRLEGGRLSRLPVKTAPGIPKGALAGVMRRLEDVTARAPVSAGQVLLELPEYGAAVVATRSAPAFP